MKSIDGCSSVNAPDICDSSSAIGMDELGGSDRTDLLASASDGEEEGHSQTFPIAERLKGELRQGGNLFSKIPADATPSGYRQMNGICLIYKPIMNHIFDDISSATRLDHFPFQLEPPWFLPSSSEPEAIRLLRPSAIHLSRPSTAALQHENGERSETREEEESVSGGRGRHICLLNT